ncbi:MAG: hypothetical protein ABUL71_00265, partial [Gemmatimonadota bacterium]
PVRRSPMDGTDARGASILLVLVAAVVAGSLGLVALHAAAIRARLVADARWQIEGVLVAGSALASARTAHRADLDTLADGGVLVIAPVVRADGWVWTATATRTGAIVRLDVQTTRRGSDGVPIATRRASLMLARNAADTVRVLGSRARF